MSTTQSNSPSTKPPTPAGVDAAQPPKIPRNCVPGISIRPGAFLCIVLMLAQFAGALVARLLLPLSPQTSTRDAAICAAAMLLYLALALAAWVRHAKVYRILDWVAFGAYLFVMFVVGYPVVRLGVEQAGYTSLEIPVLAVLFVVNVWLLYQMQRYAVVLEHEETVRKGEEEGRV